jgi:hypothetical protein
VSECARRIRYLSGGEGAAGDKRVPKRFGPATRLRFETPWQDRQTLFASPLDGDARQFLAVLLMAFGSGREP